MGFNRPGAGKRYLETSGRGPFGVPLGITSDVLNLALRHSSLYSTGPYLTLIHLGLGKRGKPPL